MEHPFFFSDVMLFAGCFTIYAPILSIEHTLTAAIYIWDEMFFFSCRIGLVYFSNMFFLTVFASVSNIYALKLFL